MLVFGLLISGSCGIGLYWAGNTTTIVLLSAGYISIASIASTTLVGSIVSLFPTATRWSDLFVQTFKAWPSFDLYRTMTVSLAMMFGRSGAIIGNLLFPLLLSFGCLPPFAMIGATALSKFRVEYWQKFINSRWNFHSLQFCLSADSQDNGKSSSVTFGNEI